MFCLALAHSISCRPGSCVREGTTDHCLPLIVSIRINVLMLFAILEAILHTLHGSQIFVQYIWDKYLVSSRLEKSVTRSPPTSCDTTCHKYLNTCATICE